MGAPKGHKPYANSEGKLVGGRPTKLTPQLVAKAEGYLAWCEAHPLTRYTMSGNPVPAPRLPTVAGLSLHLDVSRETLYAWSRENKTFSDILGRVTSSAESLLSENGVIGTFNPLMAKFLLSADHGKREKSDVTSDGKRIEVPLLGGLTRDE